MARLGPMTLDRRLGGGALGEVWAARLPDGASVAIKVLSARGCRDPVFRDAFREEVRAVARLDHPHIVAVFDHGEVGPDEALPGEGLVTGAPYLVMERITGGALTDQLAKLPWDASRNVLLALLDALAHAHARGVVHRDVKPANVLLAGRHRMPRLTDFGLVHALDRQPTGEPSAGTPSYMAPEQFVGEWRDFGPWTDLYAVGSLAMALLTGAPPYSARDWMEAMHAHLTRPIPRLHARFPVPDGLEAWIRTCLEKDPAWRFQSAAEAARALQALPVEPGGDLPALVPLTLGGDGEGWRHGPGSTAPLGFGLWGLRPVPIVGRDAERDVLWAALDRVRRGGVEVVVLTGEEGVGKTRLARWLAERVTELGAGRVLTASHGPVPGPGDGLEPMVARHLRAEGLRGEALDWRLGAALKAIGTFDDADTDAVRGLLGPAVTGRHAALRRFLGLAAARQPVLIVIEDAQWGLDAIEFTTGALAAALGGCLFVLTARDEALHERPREAAALATLRRMTHVTALPVPPLPPPVLAALMRDHLELEPGLADTVAGRSTGNPLFAVQLVGDWVQRGLLRRASDQWELRPGASVPLPDDLHALWRERVAALLAGRPASAGVALEIAAALGLEVDGDEWAAACVESRVNVPTGLVDALLSRGFATGTQRRWTFAHALLRESVERLAVDAGRMRHHHRRCARVIRRSRHPRAEERLGRHLLAAGVLDEAVEPLLQGAAARLSEDEPGGAAALLDDAETALAGLPPTPDDRRRVALALLRSRVEARQGDHAEAARQATVARSVAEQHGWTDLLAESHRRLGVAAARQGRPEAAEHHHQEAARLAAEVGDDALHAKSLRSLAWSWLARGEVERADLLLREGLRAAGAGHESADWLRAIGRAARLRGRWDEARSWFEEALQVHEAHGAAGAVASTLDDLADAARHQGRFDEAERLAGDALQRHERLGAQAAAVSRLHLGLVALARGDLDVAEPLLAGCVERFAGQRLGPLEGLARLALLQPALARGDLAAWDDHLDAAMALVEAASFVDPDLPWLLEQAGNAAARAGDRRRARAAWRLAGPRWAALGRPDKAAQVASKLK